MTNMVCSTIVKICVKNTNTHTHTQNIDKAENAVYQHFFSILQYFPNPSF